MKLEEFYSKYANTPIGDRAKVVIVIRSGINRGEMCLQDIYQRVHEIDEQTREILNEQSKLIMAAEDFWNK